MQWEEGHRLAGQDDLSGISDVALTSSMILGSLFNLSIIFLTYKIHVYLRELNCTLVYKVHSCLPDIVSI